MPSIDLSIQRQASGAALQLAQAHESEHALKLYGGWFCPFVQRAWIVLEEKAIPYQYIEINPYEKESSFLALNPRGLVSTLAVPVGIDDEEAKPLYESIVICEYLDEAYGGDTLLPGDPYQRARCRLWIDHIASRAVPAFYRLLQHTPESTYGIDEAREQLHGHLKTFAHAMDSTGGPWFLGSTFSLVDIMLAPWAKRLWLIDHYKPGGLGIPEEADRGHDQEVWARWEMWYQAIINRDSVLATWSEDQDYIAVYKRYAENTTQSEVAKATRRGGRLP
jgi:glutathione S-transferase